MRLMNPGLGEMLDRLSILELKLAHGGGERFEEERQELVAHLLLKYTSVPTYLTHEIFKTYSTLAAVNAALWQSEDALRALRPVASTSELWGLKAVESNTDVVVQTYFLAHKIQLLNDRRAELVREIGRLAGEEDHREKLSGGQG